VELAYSLEFKEWVVAHRDWYGARAHNFKVGCAKFYFVWYQLLILSLLFMIGTFLLYRWTSHRSTTFFVFAVGGPLYLLLFLHAAKKRKRLFRDALNKDLTVRVLDSGIEIDRAQVTHVEHKWEAIAGTYESRDFFLLYISKKFFIPLPKRAMNPGDRTKILEMFASKGVDHLPA